MRRLALICLLFASTVAAQNLDFVRKAANGNDPRAQVILAERYWAGDGVPQDYAVAFNWFKKAASQKPELAGFRLGTAYRAGVGTSQDDEKALVWFTLALDLGDERARVPIQQLYEYGGDSQQNRAYVELGRMLVTGDSVRKDVNRGLSFLRLAVDRSHRPAEFQLCKLYLDGILQRDEESALKYCKAASEHRVKGAAAYFGMARLQGHGIPADVNEGWNVLSTTPETYFERGLVKMNGLDGNRNATEAYKYFVLSAFYSPSSDACANLISLRALLSDEERKKAIKEASDEYLRFISKPNRETTRAWFLQQVSQWR